MHSGFLGCEAVLTCMWVRGSFRKNLLPTSSLLMIEAVYPSEAVVPIYKSVRRQNPEGSPWTSSPLSEPRIS